MGDYVITTGDGHGRAISRSAIWARGYFRDAAVFGFVIAALSSTMALQILLIMPSVTVIDLIVRYAIRKRLHRQRALGRRMDAVVTGGFESKAPRGVPATGFGCAFLYGFYGRSRVSGFGDCALGAETAGPLSRSARV